MKKVMLSIGVICTMMSCNISGQGVLIRDYDDCSVVPFVPANVNYDKEIIKACDELLEWFKWDVNNDLLPYGYSESYIWNVEYIKHLAQRRLDEGFDTEWFNEQRKF
jgi:hypothetical protein